MLHLYMKYAFFNTSLLYVNCFPMLTLVVVCRIIGI